MFICTLGCISLTGSTRGGSSWVGGSFSGEVPRNSVECGGIEQRSLWTWTGRGDTIVYMVFFWVYRGHVIIQRCFPPFEAHDSSKVMCFYTLITYMYWRRPDTTELYTFWTVGMSRCSNVSQQTNSSARPFHKQRQTHTHHLRLSCLYCSDSLPPSRFCRDGMISMLIKCSHDMRDRGGGVLGDHRKNNKVAVCAKQMQ